jgi:hypothetical protein
MNRDNQTQLAQRITDAAETVLADRRFVSPIDVLIGIGWLPPSVMERWRQGRLPYLERGATANLSKLSTAMRLFRTWAVGRGLRPSETAYVTSGRHRQPLRFSASGEEAIERAYRTHWISPELSEKKRERLVERQNRPPDLVVISALGDWTCSQCAGGEGERLLCMEEPGPVCLACADMDHLVFLASGDAALSRRARKASRLSAVVVRYSRARRRYERQGLLVEEAALEHAEAECAADQEVRAERRLREGIGRDRDDLEFQGRIAGEIVRLFPACPAERAQAIAGHTGARGSGRVGRTAAARALDGDAITHAVVASVRHEDTPYDDLLMSGVPRTEARERVLPEVDQLLRNWRGE